MPKHRDRGPAMAQETISRQRQVTSARNSSRSLNWWSWAVHCYASTVSVEWHRSGWTNQDTISETQDRTGGHDGEEITSSSASLLYHHFNAECLSADCAANLSSHTATYPDSHRRMVSTCGQICLHRALDRGLRGQRRICLHRFPDLCL